MAIWQFLIGSLLLLATSRALIIGAASASGSGITRAEEPTLYWVCITLGLGGSAFLLWMGLST